MTKKEKKHTYDLEKHTSFFNWAKRYFWLINEKEIGNLERNIIKEYNFQMNKIMEETSLQEFSLIWIELFAIRDNVLRKKKNDLRKDIKPDNVLDFLQF